MYLYRFIRPFLLLVCLGTLAITASANSIPDLEKRLKDHQTRLLKLQQDHEIARRKRESAEEKLQESQRELTEKALQLAEMRVSAGANPTAEQQAFIDNEIQRLSLAELSIKSSTAALERLQRNEQKLRDSIAATEKSIRDTERSITTLRARQEADAREREELVERRLRELQEENERLRLAMEEEARRAQAAAEEAARLAELARQQEEARLALEAAKAAAAQDAQAVMNLSPPTHNRKGAEPVDMSQVVLEGEPPIYKDEDTINVVMRGRALDKPVAFVPVGPNRYRAEVRLEPGRSFFDLRNRRYRGIFPGNEVLPYVFYYDLNGEKPVLTVMHKSAEEQIISNAKDPF
jgi:hypothetical protein